VGVAPARDERKFVPQSSFEMRSEVPTSLLPLSELARREGQAVRWFTAYLVAEPENHFTNATGPGATVLCAERLVAGTAERRRPGDRTGQFHGNRSQPAAVVSLTSRRRILSIEKAPFPGLFP